ncbi:MAG: type ISP restriction/modification enzyme [Phycisphaerae bacterium]|nr:type ISP restriction/modification enzyme [Phycisphaerae bacterium]
MPKDHAILAALKRFADAVSAKMNQLSAGEPEDQLRAPFEQFIAEVGKIQAIRIVCTGETRLPGRIGKPDYAVHSGGLLTGYVELKAPGTGANPNRFAGHNRDQWKRFKAIPNLLYTDGNEWGLYRTGNAVRPLARMSGDLGTDGKKAVTAKDAQALLPILTDFLSWQPTIPTKAKGKIDLAAFADMLAPLCRMLREDVTEALKDPASPLVQLAKDWRQLLFPDADDDRFADAYAQTVTFALLLARSEGADPLALANAQAALAAEHSLLSRALQVLTDPNAQAEISASLNLLIRVIGQVPPAALTGPEDPWLYFYEDFLAAYDPKLRKDAGAYYTPVEVVRAQVRLIDDLLTNRLAKPLGFADPDVVTLDPAAGTGTYLLGVIDHALAKVEAQQGAGAVPGQASALAGNIYGFEIMVGPYAVTELRVSRALADKGAKLPAGGSHVYLTDTLEGPNTPPPVLPFYLKPIAEQHAKALKVKAAVPVIVCLGNPPYDRHEAADETNKARTGHWVRWGEDGKGTAAIFKDFLDPALAAGHGMHVKNLYNLYVYFWRWAMWKVFEHKTSAGPGVVSFISASSYLDGDAFCGIREHMRRLCDEIWVLDLGGEGRGTRKSQNVFAIQTPVAIAVTARYGKADRDTPAKVHFARIEGTRQEKLKALYAIQEFATLTWQDCPDDWHAPFRPAGGGAYFDWPLLIDVLPWQHSGIECKRTWPIAPDEGTLRRRWRALLKASDRAVLFRETGDRTVAGTYAVAITPEGSSKRIADLPANAATPPIVQCGFRSFDRQRIIADARLMSRPRPDLWAAHGEGQVYLTTLLNHPLGGGPALTSCCDIPDRHHLRGSYGGKDVIPLYRDAAGKEANILPGLLDVLTKEYWRKVTPEDFLAYVYGLLAQPAFTDRFAEELGTRELRVPLTKDAGLFAKIQDVGARLLWLHTYGQRFVPKGKHLGQVPKGKARCTKPVPGGTAAYPEKYEYNDATHTLHVGDGEFAPVAPEVYEFEVSGLKVVQSWLGYRKKEPKGKKSSPLDKINPDKWPTEFTTELLELLWVLEATLAEYPAQAKLLSAVVKGPCFKAAELPPVPDAARKPPSRPTGKQLFDEHLEEDT